MVFKLTWRIRNNIYFTHGKFKIISNFIVLEKKCFNYQNLMLKVTNLWSLVYRIESMENWSKRSNKFVWQISRQLLSLWKWQMIIKGVSVLRNELVKDCSISIFYLKATIFHFYAWKDRCWTFYLTKHNLILYNVLPYFFLCKSLI